MADGEVIQGPTPFGNAAGNTHYLVIEHGHIIVRYGELEIQTYVQSGQRVAGGQKIGRVGFQVGNSMLHLEMYGTRARSPLSVSAQQSKRRAADDVPYMRRMDLIDPTATLDAAMAHMPNRYNQKPTKRGWCSY